MTTYEAGQTINVAVLLRDMLALTERVAALERLVEVLIDAKLTASQNDAGHLRAVMRLERELQAVRDRLAKMEKEKAPSV